MGFDDIDRRFQPRKPVALECLCCGSTDGVEMESSRTCYPFEGDADDPANPNRPVPLCRPCAAGKL